MAQATVLERAGVDAPPAVSPGRVRAAAVEVAALLAGVLAIMWLAPLTPWREPVARILVIGLSGLLVACEWRDRVGLRELGLRFDNFLRVLRDLAWPVGIFIAVVVAIGWALGTLRLGSRFLALLAGVPVWALLQQYLLLGFVHRRLRVLLGPGHRSVLATTLVFSVVHLPNPVLVVACALGGFVWARQFDRSPNLLAHAVTHAIGSAFLANSLPDAVLRHMVVGYRYFGS